MWWFGLMLAAASSGELPAIHVTSSSVAAELVPVLRAELGEGALDAGAELVLDVVEAGGAIAVRLAARDRVVLERRFVLDRGRLAALRAAVLAIAEARRQEGGAGSAGGSGDGGGGGGEGSGGAKPGAAGGAGGSGGDGAKPGASSGGGGVGSGAAKPGALTGAGGSGGDGAKPGASSGAGGSGGDGARPGASSGGGGVGSGAAKPGALTGAGGSGAAGGSGITGAGGSGGDGSVAEGSGGPGPGGAGPLASGAAGSSGAGPGGAGPLASGAAGSSGSNAGGAEPAGARLGGPGVAPAVTRPWLWGGASLASTYDRAPHLGVEGRLLAWLDPVHAGVSGGVYGLCCRAGRSAGGQPALTGVFRMVAVRATADVQLLSWLGAGAGLGVAHLAIDGRPDIYPGDDVVYANGGWLFAGRAFAVARWTLGAARLAAAAGVEARSRSVGLELPDGFPVEVEHLSTGHIVPYIELGVELGLF